jgi:cobalt/nickel transport system permease protein
MKHDFIDKHSNLNSVIHRLDPRMKLMLCFCFLISISSMFELSVLGFYLVLVIVLTAISKVPFHYYLKKLIMVTPLAVLFGVFVYLSYLMEHRVEFSIRVFSSHSPVSDMIVPMVLKIYLSVFVITLLVSCTRFNDLLWGLRKFKFPLIVTTLSKLVYTYIFVFIDELHRTLRAYKSRTPVLRISRIKVYGSIAGGILLRSMDRSEYIYRAMVSRGFTGEFPDGNSNRLKPADLAAAVFFLAIVVTASIVIRKI